LTKIEEAGIIKLLKSFSEILRVDKELLTFGVKFEFCQFCRRRLLTFVSMWQYAWCQSHQIISMDSLSLCSGEILSDIKEVEEFMAKHQVPSESSKKRKKAEVAKNPLHAGIDLENLYMRTGMKCCWNLLSILNYQWIH
jgi:hypothetical protein